jgi:hypothetical protein
MHVERAPYVRLARQAFHPAPGEPARPTLKHIVRRNDVPVYYPVSNKVVAVPTVARGQIPAASPADVAHYPSYTTRTPAFTPQGTSIVRRTYVRMSATPDHRAKRLRTVVLALDQPRP